ncbi:membrane protein [Paenibacillus baekrokdamisoli]|uniref:Membrane protein n=2 Tax=Paenibacillus baekrokdamisoli TaxID=1712516 RepID=A0A3G9J0T1_9BACL|nr:DUF418 domain-containing protein [Paenibacillus baekrokdamisoli]BBH24152.1 membrane protein [Paenibacillus baekrokdamisoli]
MSSKRITGFDLARALSIFGMIIVNFKISMVADTGGPEWLSAFAGLFEGRASAVFVVLAGIGFSIMTRKARQGDAKELRKSRLLVWKRSIYLLILGFLLLLFGWSADILHYYALFLFLASLLIRASGKVILSIAAILLAASQLFLLKFDYTMGWNSSFHMYTDFWTIEGFMRNLWFNGFHPALPWFCFFLVGMWLGRINLTDKSARKKWLVASLITFIGVEVISFAALKIGGFYLGEEVAIYLFQTKPMPPNILYMVSATSTAIAFILLSVYVTETSFARRFVSALIQTGQMALTHYVLHVTVGLGLLEVFGILENGSLPFAVLYSAAYFVVAILFSYLWRLKFNGGPFESIMRKL